MPLGDGPRSDDDVPLPPCRIHPTSFIKRRPFSFRLIMARTKEGGCSDSHALGTRSNEVECSVPCNLHRTRITHVSANARIQGARSLFFLRFHRALHRGIITRDGSLLVLPAPPRPSHPPFLVLFVLLGLNRHHPLAIAPDLFISQSAGPRIGGGRSAVET